jgi:hypothetical protein
MSERKKEGEREREREREMTFSLCNVLYTLICIYPFICIYDITNTTIHIKERVDLKKTYKCLEWEVSLSPPPTLPSQSEK